MGSQPYFYFCEFQEDVDIALQKLRQQEFKQGRYYPATNHLDFPPNLESVVCGAQHSSVEEAFKAGGPEGTGSILDIQRISTTPEQMTSSPLPTEFLLRFFKTEMPTRDMVERIIIREELIDEDDVDPLDAWDDFADLVWTPGGCHFVIYEDDKPSEIFLWVMLAVDF